MKFQCKHCGRCCSDTKAQVNLTLGDIQRVISLLSTGFDKLFWKSICIAPFANPDNSLVYDLELGLNMPCKFRITKKCSIYKARPLNCRIFPYWILSHPDKDGYKRFIDSSHKCIMGYKEDPVNKRKYKEYKDKIGGIILDESSVTDEFFSRIGLKAMMKLPDNFKASEEKERIEFCKNMMNKERYKGLPLILSKELKNHEFIGIKELEEFEKAII